MERVSANFVGDTARDTILGLKIVEIANIPSVYQKSRLSTLWRMNAVWLQRQHSASTIRDLCEKFRKPQFARGRGLGGEREARALFKISRNCASGSMANVALPYGGVCGPTSSETLLNPTRNGTLGHTDLADSDLAVFGLPRTSNVKADARLASLQPAETIHERA